MKLPMTRRTALFLFAQVAVLMLVACYLVQALQPKVITPIGSEPLAQAVDTLTASLPSPTFMPTETVSEPTSQTATSSPTIPLPTEPDEMMSAATSASAVPTMPSFEPTPADYILWSDAGDYLGEQRTVCGPVEGTHFADASRGRPTFLNIGEDYPSPDRFVVLIWGEYRDNFLSEPEIYYEGKTICAEGEIQEYEGIFEIEVRSPAEIEIQP